MRLDAWLDRPLHGQYSSIADKKGMSLLMAAPRSDTRDWGLQGYHRLERRILQVVEYVTRLLCIIFFPMMFKDGSDRV